jgi:hypothetical protein
MAGEKPQAKAESAWYNEKETVRLKESLVWKNAIEAWRNFPSIFLYFKRLIIPECL